jgi:hypothetical protein
MFGLFGDEKLHFFHTVVAVFVVGKNFVFLFSLIYGGKLVAFAFQFSQDSAFAF